MRGLVNIIIVIAKVTMFIVVLAWVVVGQIKPAQSLHPATTTKSPKTVGRNDGLATDRVASEIR